MKHKTELCQCPDCVAARLIDRQRARIEELTGALRGLLEAYRGNAVEWAHDPCIEAARDALGKGGGK